jgi:hypothetical protein
MMAGMYSLHQLTKFRPDENKDMWGREARRGKAVGRAGGTRGMQRGKKVRTGESETNDINDDVKEL